MQPGNFTPIRIALAFIITLAACKKDRFNSSNDQLKTATVSTVAGTGTAGDENGNSSSAEFFLMQYIKNAEFNRPSGVATDADGNVYVADASNMLIRKITPSGEVSTIAHNYANEENEVTPFLRPIDVATDAQGNTYVADEFTFSIIKISPTEYPRIFAGGHFGFKDGTGTNAEFKSISGLATDASGNLYVADRENNRIRKITPSGEVSTFAGNESTGTTDGVGTGALFDGPNDVSTDRQGNVYVADYNNNSIRQITPDGMVTTYASIAGPQNLTIDDEGNIYVTDGGQSIQKITLDRQVSLFAGNGEGGYANGNGSDAKFNYPSGLAIDAHGIIYVADGNNNRIRKITPTAEVSNFAGNGVEGSTDNNDATPKFDSPAGIAIDFLGNLYVADVGNNKIRKITPSGEVSTFAGNDEEGFGDGKGTAAKFSWPSGIATDPSGNVYVADTRNNRIRKITPDGTVTTIAGSGIQGYKDDRSIDKQEFNNPVSLAIDALGSLYVVDAGNYCIRKISPLGDVSTVAGDGTRPTSVIEGGLDDATGTAARFIAPWGIAADTKGNLYVADAGCHCIRKINPVGLVTIVAGDITKREYSVFPGYLDGNATTSRFKGPAALAVDADGNVFIADALNNCVRMFTSVGNEKYIVATLAGSSVPGFADGDDSQAQFNLPAGLAIDAQGNIYVADVGNHSIRKIVVK